MKLMGLDAVENDKFDEEDEYDKILRQMGIKADGNDNEDIDGLLKGNFDNSDDAILAGLEQTPFEQV